MTTVFEARFTNPAEWIAEAKADAEHGAIQDGIIRIAVRRHDATFGQLSDRPYRNHGDDRTTPWYKALFLEATYVARNQLVKLSAYAGVVYTGPEKGQSRLVGDVPDKAFENNAARTAATNKAVSELARKVQAAVARVDGVEIRGGGLYVEEGAWVADPESPIDSPPALTCATCLRDIYFANEQWRHRDGDRFVGFAGEVRIDKGRAEAIIESPCPTCAGALMIAGRNCGTCRRKGRIETLHHLADPEVEDRKL